MISKAYSDFFRSLEQNNNKDWFHENKKTYEKEVKGPFLKLISEILETVGQWDQRIDPDPKKSLFRINRDIRFSKDKSPYNTIMKAALAPGGRRSGLPGYYVGISADKIHVGGGLFDLDTATISKFRTFLSENYDELEDIMGNSAFKSHFGAIQGDRVTRLNGALKDKVEKMPLLLYKQFYSMELIENLEKCTSDTLITSIGAVRPLVEFIEKGVKS